MVVLTRQKPRKPRRKKQIIYKKKEDAQNIEWNDNTNYRFPRSRDNKSKRLLSIPFLKSNSERDKLHGCAKTEKLSLV
jgi:hypothetical protein